MGTTRRRWTTMARPLAVAGLVALATGAMAGGVGPELISAALDGTVGNGSSWQPSVSKNGKVIAFYGEASDLVADDDNGYLDVFVVDTKRGTTTLVSRDESGEPGDDDSEGVCISGNGRFVAFATIADLTPGDENGEYDIYVRDLRKDTLDRITLAFDGGEPNGESWVYGKFISDNGRYVVFQSEADNLLPGDDNEQRDIFLFDRKKRVLTLVSRATDGGFANGASDEPSISGNGKFVAFHSRATDLVDGDVNGRSDVFVFDVRRGLMLRASEREDGAGGNGSSSEVSIDGRGKTVGFRSNATNLFPNDTNGSSDYFVFDVRKRTVRSACIAPDGSPFDGYTPTGALSRNGRIIALSTSASNLGFTDGNGFEDVYLVDLKKGTIQRASIAADGGDPDVNAYVYAGGLSASGRIVVFESTGRNYLPDGVDDNNDQDVWCVDVRKSR